MEEKRISITGCGGEASDIPPDLFADRVRIKINGEWHEFQVGKDIEPQHTLAYVLREKLGLLGTKISCDTGECGACTVLVDGSATLSCMTIALSMDGHEVTTIEGLAKNDPVILAFANQCEPGYGTAMQCGYCTPGFVMSAKGLLNENPDPTVEEIKHALSGNLCRCGTYPAVIRAVLHASETMRNEKEGSKK
jgi:aerobic-type carbon monoxide dehydrogenase small subunit (CoxS/CutS family)